MLVCCSPPLHLFNSSGCRDSFFHFRWRPSLVKNFVHAFWVNEVYQALLAFLAEHVSVRTVERGWLAGALGLGVTRTLVKYSCLGLLSRTDQSCTGIGRVKMWSKYWINESLQNLKPFSQPDPEELLSLTKSWVCCWERFDLLGGLV